MDTASWLPRLEGAGTADQVIAVVNDYIRSRDPRVLAMLPEECAVRPVKTAAEVVACAYSLAAYHCHDDNARGIQRLAEFFRQATTRLADLPRTDPEPRVAGSNRT